MVFNALIVIILCNFVVIGIATDICGIGWKRSIIAQNRFYFMGGKYLSLTSEGESPRAALYWLDLDSEFPVEGFLNDSFLQNTSAPMTSAMGTGAFWIDKNETRIYVFGNLDKGDAAQSELQSYDIQKDAWSPIFVSGGNYNDPNRFVAMHASSSQGGGSLSFATDNHVEMSPSQIIFNSSKPGTPSWAETSSRNIPFLLGGTTQYLRFGSAGILIYIGGQTRKSDNKTMNGLRGMQTISVFDIATSTWSTIIAQGDIPPPRYELCSAVSAAPDDSSFQIVVYGGANAENTIFDDIYLLTIPAFRWIKIQDPTHETLTKNLSTGRLSASCTTFKERQMVVIGGRNTFNFTNAKCSREYPMLRLLDTTTFRWQTRFPLQNTTYEVPKVVTDLIGGDGAGGAYPASRWQDTLGDKVGLFSKTIPKYVPPQIASHATNSTYISRPPSPSKTSPGMITGIVLGSVGALLVSAAVCLLLAKKRRHHLKNESKHLFWHKAELPTDNSSKPWANPQQIERAEIEGSVPSDLQPEELEANSIYELHPAPMERALYERSEEESPERIELDGNQR